MGWSEKIRRKKEREAEEEISNQIDSFSASRAECSEHGLIYVGGFLCHKLAKLHPWMGSRTCDLQYSESNKWMEMLSRGGLYIHSDKLTNIWMSLNLIFHYSTILQYHFKKTLL